MAVDPVKGVRECSEMSQMKAETKILIYKLVLVAKNYVLSLQKKLKTWEDKSAPPGTQRVKGKIVVIYSSDKLRPLRPSVFLTFYV